RGAPLGEPLAPADRHPAVHALHIDQVNGVWGDDDEIDLGVLPPVRHLHVVEDEPFGGSAVAQVSNGSSFRLGDRRAAPDDLRHPYRAASLIASSNNRRASSSLRSAS